MDGLDAYITGQNIHDEKMVKHICPKCRAEKDVAMTYELGGWFYNNDDEAYCQNCQVEMFIADSVPKSCSECTECARLEDEQGKQYGECIRYDKKVINILSKPDWCGVREKELQNGTVL